MVVPENNIPTILAAFGASGDLMRRKVIPSLYYLYEKKQLPDMFKIVGFSRRDWDNDEFREFVSGVLAEHRGSAIKKEALDPFLALFEFQRGDFDEAQSYADLKKTFDRFDDEWKVCTNKLFYLAVAPEFYETIFQHLSRSHLTDPCDPEEGWTRVIVEKPFGTDEKTARSLDIMLGSLFKEEQIYRIDHYLAKEMLQNILTFRFSNNLFEPSWGKDSIESIDIRLYEEIGVEKRGAFYDAIGTFRDVGQNHFLQVLALLTMENPGSFDAAAIQENRAALIESLEIPTTEDVARDTFRAQYDGYREIAGVAPKSETETFFAVRAKLKGERWRGVDITMEGGKRMGAALKEAVITFKHPSPCLCPALGEHHRNQIVIRLEPKEEILIEFWSKKPGFSMETEPRMFHFLLREDEARVQYVEEYAKLVLDAIRGDQTLFVSTREIQGMWRYADAIMEGWSKGSVSLFTYPPDTRDAAVAAREYFAKRQPDVSKEIALIGLGKMGGNIARRLISKGWAVHGFDYSTAATEALAREGMIPLPSLSGISKLASPRVVWLMVPHGDPVTQVLFGKDGLAGILKKGDIIVDGGNSYFKESEANAKKLAKKGIRFIDIGFSGGPGGARDGGCLMVGGDEKSFKELEHLYRDVAREDGYRFFAGAGAGHFVKMVHNGIEYGMMQAIAEGFGLMKKSKFKLDLAKVAEIYNRGSVIESRLVSWLVSAFRAHGTELKDVSGIVSHSGEGQWTVKTAKELKIPVKVIEESFRFRVRSARSPSYIGKVVSALRGQFGGHTVNKGGKK